MTDPTEPDDPYAEQDKPYFGRPYAKTDEPEFGPPEVGNDELAWIYKICAEVGMRGGTAYDYLRGVFYRLQQQQAAPAHRGR